MKKSLLLSVALFVLPTAFFHLLAGSVTINQTMEGTPSNPCNLNQRIVYNISGTTSGYNVLDTISVKLFYGDGNSHTNYARIDSNGVFSSSFVHIFSAAGQYTAAYIATSLSDQAADTVVVPNAVTFADTCGEIKGRVYVDQNSDCSFNTGDFPMANYRVDAILNGQAVAYSWTDSNGFYSLSVGTSQTYTVAIGSQNFGYNIICPSGGSHIVSAIPSTGNDFAINCGGGFDFYGSVSSQSVPGRTTKMYVATYNALCLPASGTLKVVFDDSLFSYAGNSFIPPTAISGDTVIWNFSNISSGYYAYLAQSFNMYTDTTAQIGDTVCVTYIVEPLSGDSNPSNNVKRFCFPVRASFDPNIKLVQPIGVGDSGRVLPNTDLTYTIHFQNTGTFMAYNVYILDTLDTAMLDVNSLEVLGSSHDVKVNLQSAAQNVLRFRFDDIYLADSSSNEPASHGWVTYSIKQQPNLNTGSLIRNSAAIYFDYNPPVITADAINLIDTRVVGIQEITKASLHFVSIYPNPSSDVINIVLSGNEGGIAQIKLINMDGKLIRELAAVNKNANQMNVGALNTGIYLLEIIDLNGNRQLSKVVIR